MLLGQVAVPVLHANQAAGMEISLSVMLTGIASFAPWTPTYSTHLLPPFPCFAWKCLGTGMATSPLTSTKDSALT